MQIPAGATNNSVIYFLVPSPMAEKMLYYPMCMGHFTCDRNYLTERAIYPSYLLLYMQQGDLHVQTRSFTGTAQQGDVLLLNCYEYHKYYCSSSCEFLFVHIAGSNTKDLCDEIVRVNGPIFKPFNETALTAGINRFIDSAAAGLRQDEIENSLSVYSMLLQLFNSRSLRSTSIEKHTPLDETMRYIAANLDKPLTLDELAERSGFSKYHFARLFKLHVHLSPYQYIRISRIQKAQCLLTATHMSVKEIARCTGFNSESNFSFAFSQHVGMSPQEFRRNF